MKFKVRYTDTSGGKGWWVKENTYLIDTKEEAYIFNSEDKADMDNFLEDYTKSNQIRIIVVTDVEKVRNEPNK